MTRLFFILLLLIPFRGLSQDLTAGLLACYSFTGNANDQSGNGNNGTVSGAVLTNDRFGNVNSAYQFDGVDDHIKINPVPFRNNSYTYSLWAKASSIPDPGTVYFVFSAGGPGGDQSIGLNNSYSGPNSGWTGGGYNSGGSNQFYSAGSLPAVNVWYHLVVTRDNSSTSFYVNGNRAGTVANFNPAAFYGSTNTQANIGGRSTLVQFYHGAVDDLRVYNRALSAAEVDMLYKGGDLALAALRSDYQTPCTGTPVTYTITPAPPGTSYQWFVNGVKQGEPTASATFTFSHPASAAGYQATVAVELASGASCVSRRLESTLTFSPPAPVLAELQASTMVPCSGSAVTFRVSPGITGARYQWRLNGVLQQTELPTLQYTFPPSASQYEALINVEVTPPDIPCAGKTVRELRLTLYPSLTLTCPEADFAISGDSVQYKAEVSGGQPPYQHLWVIGSDTLRGPDRRAVQYRFAEAGKYNIFLRVTDSRGCQTSCGLEQDVTRPLLFPNVFTPDGRGSNETFTVQYAGSNFEMNIYNRWGKLVATTGDGIKGWDGSGSASGVYFYIIRIGSREYKGWVHLLR